MVDFGMLTIQFNRIRINLPALDMKSVGEKLLSNIKYRFNNGISANGMRYVNRKKSGKVLFDTSRLYNSFKLQYTLNSAIISNVAPYARYVVNKMNFMSYNNQDISDIKNIIIR